jgi:DNA (cytosine-5)-methyltransferase 1
MVTVLDIFSGCGGISLGAHLAGMKTIAAVDADPMLSSSYQANFPKTQLYVRDIRSLDAATIVPGGVDGVVGGPPCQAFSDMGRRDENDPRRELVFEYFRVVTSVNPKFFVFENVPGLGREKNIGLLESGLAMLPRSWSIIGPILVDASEYGAPTKRRRIFVFGFDKNKMNVPAASYLLKKSVRSVTVQDAISDLRSASFVREDERKFDYWKYDGRRTPSEYASKMRGSGIHFTGNKKTDHTKGNSR